MDYFTLIPDKTCPFVRICNHTDPKILQAVMRGEAHQVPDGTVFRLKEVPDSGMPDIIFQPVFLVSQLFYQCIQIYHPYTTAAQIRLAGLRNGFLYYIPELPSADEKESFSLYEQHIYKTTDCGVETVEVSLDLSESLLRRGAWGFGLKERTKMEDTDILVPRLILDSRASILLPPNMDEMSSERIGLLYPNQPRPDQVLVYGDEKFWLSLTLTEEVSSKKALRTKLCQYRRLLMKKFRGTEIGEVYCVESVIQGEKTYYFPICTNGVTGGTCQLIFLCLIKGKEMIGTVCCSAEGWHSKTTLFRKIIGSVVDLTGTWEYTIRSKKLYEKAREYYRDY